jgi:asparagine synthase (glutamine-hydrolysing)
MCGIAGIWTIKPTGDHTIDGINFETITNRMVETLIHRGPDDQDVWVDHDVAFGHCRLKVIDLAGGKQPMTDSQGKAWLVFNGEIYNYRQLKSRLMTLGHTFQTCSDTEVLLHAYLEWGLNCLERLEGMFAFAIWDRPKHQLHLVRDRLGIKPLFWTIQKNHLYFASEIKALLTIPGWSSKINPKTLIYYLSHYQSVMGDETLFDEIHTVEPGTVVTFSQPERDTTSPSSSPSITRYWSFPIIPNSEQEDRGEGYYKAKVRDLLTQAVERQLVSDVPLGAYLSGGLDSTILVGLMTELGIRPIRTFSIGFDDPPVNEFPFSQLVSKIFGTQHTEIGIGADDYFPAMAELICFKDAPLSVPNEVPLYIMSKILKKDITVVLSGEGADELFGGYSAILRSPMDFRNLNTLTGQEKKEFQNKLSSIYGTIPDGQEDTISQFRAAYSWMTPQELDLLLQPKYKRYCQAFLPDSVPHYDLLLDFWEQKFQPLGQLLPEDRILNILETVHLPGLLARLDNTTMAASVEGRVPFTDTILLEFAAGIPLEYKLRWRGTKHQKLATFSNSLEIAERLDIPKYILKKSFQDLVPEAISQRPKASFPVPLDAWFLGPYRSLAWNTINQNKLMPEIFNMSKVENWFQSGTVEVTTPNYGLKIWMLMNLSLWLDAYFT